MNGLVIGDKGYIQFDLKKELEEDGIKLETPLKDNMFDPRLKELVQLLKKVRRTVETATGKLLSRTVAFGLVDTLKILNSSTTLFPVEIICPWNCIES